MQIWNRDIDQSATSKLVEDVSANTATPRDRAQSTLLSALNGIVYEASAGNSNPHWILRLGIWHRSRRAFGQQYCPLCFACDPIPYYRLEWRLAWVTSCLIHGCRLEDQCPHCQHPIIPHRREGPQCYNCEADLSAGQTTFAHPLAMRLQANLAQVMQGGSFVPFGLNYTHSLAVFATVRQIVKIVSLGPRALALQDAILQHLPPGIPAIAQSNLALDGKSELETMRVRQRHKIMALSARCLEGWPFMFVAYCADSRNWWSWAVKDSERRRLPFQYYDAARRYLMNDQR